MKCNSDKIAIAVSSIRVSPEKETVAGVWLNHDILLDHCEKILQLNARIKGSIIVTANKSGNTAVVWFVRVDNWEQAQAAAKTLARAVSMVTGVPSICRKLKDENQVACALAA